MGLSPLTPVLILPEMRSYGVLRKGRGFTTLYWSEMFIEEVDETARRHVRSFYFGEM